MDQPRFLTYRYRTPVATKVQTGYIGNSIDGAHGEAGTSAKFNKTLSKFRILRVSPDGGREFPCRKMIGPKTGITYDMV